MVRYAPAYRLRAENEWTKNVSRDVFRRLSDAQKAAKDACCCPNPFPSRVGIYPDKEEYDPVDCIEVWEDGKKIWRKASKK